MFQFPCLPSRYKIGMNRLNTGTGYPIRVSPTMPARRLIGPEGVTNLISSRRHLGRTVIEGESPVDERDGTPGAYPEYHGARETLWESGGTTLQG